MNIQGWMNVVQVMGGVVDAVSLSAVCGFYWCKDLKIQSIKLLSIGNGAIVDARMRSRT